MSNRSRSKPVEIGRVTVLPGERAVIDLPVAKLYTHTSLSMPVQVVNGRYEGARLFVSAAVHGDELNGVEVIRRLLKLKGLRRMRGSLIAVPIVNVHGFLDQSRYLPDRRDLNRSFPGSAKGSIAARLAHTFVTEIVAESDFGIDLHTGAVHRANLPQIRANLGDRRTLELAKAFDVPVIINANVRDGSLRQYAAENGIPTLLYEGGEALRFDDASIRVGLRGVLRVMHELGMLPHRKSPVRTMQPLIAKATRWLRAPASGIVRIKARLGDSVVAGQTVAIVSDPFGDVESQLKAGFAGIVIGQTKLPLVHEGDALINLAAFEDIAQAEDNVEELQTLAGVSR